MMKLDLARFSLKAFVIVSASTASFLVGVPTAQAKNEVSKEATELMNVLDMQKNQDATINRLVETQAAQNPVIQKHKATYLKFMQETVGWEAIKGKIVQIWQQNFTKEEMKELIAFYKTPAGKKTIQVMPDIVAKASQIGQDAVKERLPELQKRIEAEDKKSSKKK